MLVNVQDMIAWGLLVLPLIVMAWAMCVYVETALERHQYARYQRFYRIMQQLADPESSMAEKMAAAYELRRYKDYRDVIVRIFDDGHLRHDDDIRLADQLKDTVKAIGPKR